MKEEQEIITIEGSELLGRVQSLADEGWRLVQVGCTRLNSFQVDYSFDREFRLRTLRLLVPPDRPELSSITGIYWAAFAYENEIHDLFGLKFGGLLLDYGGRFYRQAAEAPFNVPPPESNK